MRRRKAAIVLTGIFLLAGFLAAGFGGALAASPKGVLKASVHWGISADWLDPSMPGLGNASDFVLRFYHDALVKPMPGELYAPGLAESWTIRPDYKVFEFKLRKGVKFHNGDEMTAEDVVFTFQRYKGTNAKILRDKLEKVEALNPNLVRVTFKSSFPNFFEYFLTGTSSVGWILPKKYIERVGDAEFKKNPVGCGPYKFVEFKPDQRMVGEAFEGFWRKVPNIKRIEFIFIKELPTRYAMIKRGEIDIATLIQDVFYQRVKNDPSLRLLNPLSSANWIVHMASQWDPKSPWSDPRVRKAASLAIDRKSLADIHMPGGKPHGTLGLDGDPEGIELAPDPYDPGQAKKLLAEAGYPKGFHGGTYVPYDGPYWPYSEQIANYWKAIGITLDTVLVDRAAWPAKRRGGMKGATFIDVTQQATIGGRLEYLLGPLKYGTYPDIQALWERYVATVDPAQRKATIGQIQKMIYDRTMFIPLNTVTSPAALGPHVKGDPYKIKRPYPIWYISPMEDVELND